MLWVRSHFFHFHAVFDKSLPKNRLVYPSSEVGAPPPREVLDQPLNTHGLDLLLYLLRFGNGTVSVTRCCRCSSPVGGDRERFQFEPPWPVLRAAAAERCNERVSELSRHCTVQHEVNTVVQQSHDVQQVTQWPVHLIDKVFNEYIAECQDTLGEFSEEEEAHHG